MNPWGHRRAENFSGSETLVCDLAVSWKVLWNSFLVSHATPPPGMSFSKYVFPQNEAVNPHPPASLLSEERWRFLTLGPLSSNLNKIWLHWASWQLTVPCASPDPEGPDLFHPIIFPAWKAGACPENTVLGIPVKTSDNHSNLVS